MSVYLQSEEYRIDLKGKITIETLRDFIEFNRLPLVVEFGPELSPKVFERKAKKHVILFTKIDDDLYDDRMEVFKEAAKYHKGKVMRKYTFKKKHRKILNILARLIILQSHSQCT